MRTIALAVFGALLLTATAVGVVVAATNKKPPKPVQMKFACASKDSGIVRYTARASGCKTSETVIDLKTGSFKGCIKQHGRRSGNANASGSTRLPAGTTRLVTSLTACGPHYQPNEKALTLPRVEKAWFCAVKRTGQLRFVVRKPRCRTNEIIVFLPARTGTPTPDPNTPAQPNPGPNNPTPNPGPGTPTTPNQPAKSAPTANADSGATTEDAPVTIDVRANDTDPDGDAFAIESVNVTGTDGTATATNDGKVTYNPTGQFDDLATGGSDTDSFTYTVKDSDGTSAPATVTVTVNGVNDAPRLTGTTPVPFNYQTGSAATQVLPASLDTADADDTNLESATVTLTTGYDNGDDTLVFTNQNGISGTFTAATGTLALTGSSSLANYRDALRSVTFQTPNSATGGARTVEYSVNDGTASSTTASQNFYVNHIPVNISLSNASVDENAASGAVVGTLTTT
ncbi:MAG: cadherin-like domain-containing protein, partial [Thermoleophilaceae bacterium]